ncbi:hypothetical protein [Egibacter rhizosphaerae]|uniref:hypothetical protein n=1 Tax=Egibacter rhizosphaerae TaxID=1670831 RepID=UPI0013F154D2|nr:hypothetical protein [Egibacter rhizosphaerae]
MVSSAFVGALSWWLEHPDPPPADQIAGWFLAFAARGYLPAMGFSGDPRSANLASFSTPPADEIRPQRPSESAPSARRGRRE